MRSISFYLKGVLANLEFMVLISGVLHNEGDLEQICLHVCLLPGAITNKRKLVRRKWWYSAL
jgi:hypothetical protein